MPRMKAFRCHRCNEYYTSGRCQNCYPKKGKRRRGRSLGRSISRKGIASRIQSILASDQLVGHGRHDAESTDAQLMSLSQPDEGISHRQCDNQEKEKAAVNE